MTVTTTPTNRIRMVRLSLGLSQAALARAVGIAPSLMSRAERGELRPWPRMRRETARALGVPEPYLFPGEAT